MAEIANYVRRHASLITLRTLDNLLHKLPLLKMEFTQIRAPQFPHLFEQLEFLADVVEDYAEGADKDLPMVAVAEAAFALMYAHNTIDLIPDSTEKLGHADDSSVVRAVLIEHEKALAAYAARHGMNWQSITIKP